MKYRLVDSVGMYPRQLLPWNCLLPLSIPTANRTDRKGWRAGSKRSSPRPLLSVPVKAECGTPTPTPRLSPTPSPPAIWVSAMQERTDYALGKMCWGKKDSKTVR